MTDSATLGQRAQQDARAVAKLLAALGTSRVQAIGRILATNPDCVDDILQGIHAVSTILTADSGDAYPDGYSVRTPDGDRSIGALRSALTGQDRATLRAVRRLAD